MSSAFRILEHAIPGQHIREYSQSTYHNQEDVINLALKQYIPIDNPNPKPGDVTLLCASGNGAPKELYEPMFEDLYNAVKSNNSFRIRAIWSADQSYEGASYELNEETLGNDPSWHDHSRDLLLAVNHFRDQMPRPIIALGHSMGGGVMVDLSIMHPRLFAGVILLDPSLEKSFSWLEYYRASYMTAFRRDVWPSREDAADSLRKNALYQSWDPRVFDLWMRYGLRNLPTLIYPTYEDAKSRSNTKEKQSTTKPTPTSSTTAVTLSTPKYQEVRAYLRPNFPAPGNSLDEYQSDKRKAPDIPTFSSATKPFYRPEPPLIYGNLPYVRPPCFMLFAGKSQFYSPEYVEDFVANTGIGTGGNGGVANGAVKHIVFKNSGHFIPMEKPKEVAEEICAWLHGRMKAWNDQEERERKEWAEKPERGRRMLNDDFVHWLKKSVEENSPSKRTDKGKL